MPLINQPPVPLPVVKPREPTAKPRARKARVFGSDTARGYAEHTFTAVFTDADGNWLDNPVLVDTGPNHGEYARLIVADQNLEAFALGILSALHDKRKNH